MAGEYECLRCYRTMRIGNSKAHSRNNLCGRCCRELRDLDEPIKNYNGNHGNLKGVQTE